MILKLKFVWFYAFVLPFLCRAVNSSSRAILSSSPTSSGTKPWIPLRRMAGGCCGIWSATSSPQMSSSSPVVWVRGNVQSTQESRAWRGDRSTPSKSAASEVRALKNVSSFRSIFASSQHEIKHDLYWVWISGKCALLKYYSVFSEWRSARLIWVLSLLLIIKQNWILTLFLQGYISECGAVCYITSPTSMSRPLHTYVSQTMSLLL